MKKSLLLLPIFTTIMLTGCQLSPTGGPSNVNASNVYAFEAATSIGLLANAVSTSPMARLAKADQTIVDEIAKYLPSVEAALTGLDSFTNVVEEASDLPEYVTKLTVSYKDIILTNNTFTMYYNETIIQEDDDHDHDYDEDHDDFFRFNHRDHDDKESIIEGIIIVGEDTFPMIGKKELDEDEFEVSFSYQTGENSFVRVKQEIENDEHEFEYEIISNGQKIYDYSLEVEHNQVELKLKDGALSRKKLEFTLFELDGKTLIMAKVKEGIDQTYHILFEKIVNAETGEISYSVIE